MRKQISLTWAICFLPLSTLFANFNSDARGTTTANFLKLGVGARAVGMGEAYSAVADDATALYWNPAGLVRIESDSVSLMHAPYLVSTYYDYGAYARRRDRHAWGVGLQYFAAGSLNETDENNTALGHFNPYDLAASFGYAYRLTEEGTSIGLAGKYIRSKIIDTASSLAMDVGLQTRPYWDRLCLAVTLANMGGKMKFEEESESLPFLFRFGSSLQVTEHWLASLDVISPKDNAPYTALGTEYVWQAAPGLALAGRLGYNSRTAGDINGVTGLSFGFGLDWKKFAFDYAFLPYGGLGITHRISLNFRWGSETHSSGHSLSYPSGQENLP